MVCVPKVSPHDKPPTHSYAQDLRVLPIFFWMSDCAAGFYNERMDVSGTVCFALLF